MNTANQPGGGISGSLRALAATVVVLASARAELIAVELQEERERGQQKLTLVFLAAVFLTMGMLLAALLVIVLLWDSYRVAAAGSMAMLYLGIGGWALIHLRHVSKNNPVPFAATMREFRDDLKLLMGDDKRDE